MRTAGDWELLVRPRFDWLLSKGFRFDTTDSSSNWVTSSRYLSDRFAVSVDQSLEFVRAEVVLVRLDGGQLPPPASRYAVSALLDNVVRARAPERLREARGGLDDVSVKAALDLWSDVLMKVTPDLLDGSDQPFADAATVVQERVRKASEPPL